jgi:hypothetical protein
MIKVPALEESVHFHVRSSALSFDRFANDYAVSKQFAPEPGRKRSLPNGLKVTIASVISLAPLFQNLSGRADGIKPNFRYGPEELFAMTGHLAI